MRIWHIVTGEYPPQPGGISDYTGRLVDALRARGEEVHVWSPPDRPARFGFSGLRAIGRGIDATRAADAEPVLILQYAPNAFGLRGANVLLCAWLWLRAWRRHDDIRVMFHEPFFYFGRQSIGRNLLALVHRVMAALLLSSSRIAYVSTDSWKKLLSPYAPARHPFVTLPIPATILPQANPEPVPARDERAIVIGHFGSYPDDVAEELEPVLDAILQAIPETTVRLIGRNSDRFRRRCCEVFPQHADRVSATGEVAAGDVASHLRACDVLVQPYPDGATTRRTSLMASLASGVATVTTLGRWSEAVWRRAGEAIALAPAGDAAAIVDWCRTLSRDASRRRALGAAGRAFYERHFTLERTVRALCGGKEGEPSVLVGVNAHPATGETERRQRTALAAVAVLDGVRRVNVQFASPDGATVDVDGFETLAALELDSNRITGRSGRQKPIVPEVFDVLAQRAIEEGCRYFAYVNADVAISEKALERVAGGGAEAYMLARTDVGGGRPSEILISGVDGFAIDAHWWVSNSWRFRPYLVGEPVWDCVYAAQLACHARASFVYLPDALTHERHETAWLSSPFAQYVQYLSALDAPYFSLWCRYHDLLTKELDQGRGLGRAAAIAEETFVWRPSALARAVQASRRVKGWVRYLASEPAS
ncbi:MAG TPA: glycosyltransferase family 4 protein [Vicinamibacterales bacterium]